MSVYAVVLNSPDETTMELVKSKWNSRAYVLTDHLAFISPEETTLTDDISNTLDIGKDKPGVVIEIYNYSGFNRKSLWEWMEKFS